MQEEIEHILEESRKLFTRPWEEVKAEIRKRQMLGKLPYQAGIFPPPPTDEELSKLPPAKSHIPPKPKA